MNPPLAAASSLLPSAEDATPRQARLLSRNVQFYPRLSSNVPMRMDCPAFCATTQPPAPLPETRTVSPTRMLGVIGKVTTTALVGLVAR